MLKEREHIDNLFADHLYNYEENAPSYIWNNIQSDIKRTKRLKKYSKIRAIAATVALLLTFGIGYYPLRYYKIVRNLEEDLLSRNKIELVTLIYAKKISRINRLQPYYYIFTDEEDFEVSEAVYNALKEQSRVRIVYAARSKTIFKFEMLPPL